MTKYVNNKRITVTKADLLNDNVSESTIEADLRSLLVTSHWILIEKENTYKLVLFTIGILILTKIRMSL